MAKQTFKVGDKVIYDCPGGDDHHCKGVVTWTGELGYEVEWSDGETFDYRWRDPGTGSCIKAA